MPQEPQQPQLHQHGPIVVGIKRPSSDALSAVLPEAKRKAAGGAGAGIPPPPPPPPPAMMPTASTLLAPSSSHALLASSFRERRGGETDDEGVSVRPSDLVKGRRLRKASSPPSEATMKQQGRDSKHFQTQYHLNEMQRWHQ